MTAAAALANPVAPFDADVVGLAIREFSHQPVAEQLRLKAALDRLAAALLEALPEAERLVFDSPDGLAIVTFCNPLDTLHLAERALALDRKLPLCVGVNRGPIALAGDAPGNPEAFGDGIAAAVTLAALATRGRFLVSRSFRDAVLHLAPARATEFDSVGSFTDSSVRSHQLFALDPRAAISRRRRLIAAGAVAVLLILGAGVGARLLISEARQPALVRLDITPHGEVFVDGESQGRTPPLTEVLVAPGPHTIEVRNPPYPPLRFEANLRAKQEMSLKHAFPVSKPRPKAPEKKEEGFFDRIFRRLGS